MVTQNLIAKTKQKLIATAKKKGITENFGEKEVSQIKIKLSFNPYGTPEERQTAVEIANFELWCVDFDLSQLK